MGVFCKKSGPFLNAGCIMYSVSIFYFTFYLFEGGAGTHPTHPPPVPTGLSSMRPLASCTAATRCVTSADVIRYDTIRYEMLV